MTTLPAPNLLWVASQTIHGSFLDGYAVRSRKSKFPIASAASTQADHNQLRRRRVVGRRVFSDRSRRTLW